MTETLTVDDTRTADLDLPEYEREEYLTDLRGLVLSGGKPYILLVVEEPESGGVNITHAGFDEGLDLARAFREIADLVEAGA